MMQYQQQAMMAQQQVQQPPPPPELPPSWDEIIAVMRDDAQRTFKVDIETDSTVAASIETDMKALQEVLGGITQLIQGLGPAVQMGAMPVEALKEIVLAVTRRAKMGNAVEDALDGIKQPPPPQEPQDNSAQVEQMRQQADMQKSQAEMQARQAEQQQSMQLEQMKLQAQQQSDAQKAQMAMQVEQMKAEQQASIEMQRLEFDKFKAQLEAETKVLVAQISAEAGAKQAQISAETSLAQSAMMGEKEGAEKAEKAEKESSTGDALAVAIQGFTAAIEQMRAPRTIIRGPDGRAQGIQ
jgi:hypothetical protein